MIMIMITIIIIIIIIVIVIIIIIIIVIVVFVVVICYCYCYYYKKRFFLKHFVVNTIGIRKRRLDRSTVIIKQIEDRNLHKYSLYSRTKK